MSQVSNKTRKNKGNSANLAPAEKIKDSSNMHCAQFPTIGTFHNTLGGIAMRIGSGRKNSLFISAARPFIDLYLLVQLKRCARRIEGIVKRSEYVWANLADNLRPDGKFYTPDAEMWDIFMSDMDAKKNSIEELGSDLLVIGKRFPKTADRLSVAINRLKKIQCEYVPKFFPVVNQKMCDDAEREYTQGKLMDLETFFNGVQGAR